MVSISFFNVKRRICDGRMVVRIVNSDKYPVNTFLCRRFKSYMFLSRILQQTFCREWFNLFIATFFLFSALG